LAHWGFDHVQQKMDIQQFDYPTIKTKNELVV
jgi:hypothetical protein